MLDSLPEDRPMSEGGLARDDVSSINPKTSKPLRKAQVLGIETRNVQKHWLKPVSLQTRTSDGKQMHTTAELLGSTEQLHPTYGPGQSNPQDLSALRTTRKIQLLGKAAIYSNSPYVEHAFETLVYSGGSIPAGPVSGGGAGTNGSGEQPRRTSGRLPRPGAKAAAIRRAKRLVSQGASFRPEVPFPDAVRVCNLYHDKTAIPALLAAYIFNVHKLPGHKLEGYVEVLAMQPPSVQLQAVAQLIQHGYYFAAVKVVYGDHELLRATLAELALVVQQGMGEEAWEVAVRAWGWQEADKDLFLSQFSELKIIAYYREVRMQLRALRGKGAGALVRVEREMMLKVITDFQAQVEEEIAAHGRAGPDESDPAAAARSRMRAEAEARAEAERARKAEARAKVAEERARKERLAAEARERARADLDTKRAAREAAVAAARDKEAAASAAREAAKEQAAAEARARTQRAPDIALRAIPEDGAEGGTRSGPVSKEPSAVMSDHPGKPPSKEASAASSQHKSLSPAPASKEASKASMRAPSAEPSTAAQGIPGKEASKSSLSPEPSQPPGAVGKEASQVSMGAGAAVGAAEASHESLPKEASRTSVAREPSAQEAATAGEEATAPGENTAAAAPSPAGSRKASERGGEERSVAGSRRASSSGARSPAAAAASPKAASPLPSPKGSPAYPVPGAGSGASPFASPKASPAGSAKGSVAGSRRASRADGPATGLPGTSPRSSRLGTPVGAPPSANAYASLPATPRDSQHLSASRPPSVSRPPTRDEEAAAVQDGLAELKRAGSAARSKAAEAAARASGSASGSRLGTPAGTGPKALEDAAAEQVAVTAMFGGDDEAGAGGAADFDAQRAALAREMEEEAAQALEQAVAAKAGAVASLEAERESLVSAQSARRSATPSEPSTPADRAADAKEAARIAAVEAKLVAEKEALAALEAERKRHEDERRGLNDRLASTMKMFQEQLAHTIRMAAMLQAQRIMTGAPAESVPELPQMPLPQEVDEPPSPDEVDEYARYLGIDVEADPELVYIAEWALTAPVPEGWTVHLDTEGHEFFHSAATNQSTYEHPMDEHYRQYYVKKKEEKQAVARAQRSTGKTGAQYTVPEFGPRGAIRV